MLIRLNQKSKIKNLQSIYDRWAPLYPPTAHNPLMRAEQTAMLSLLPDVRGARALDLACGTGRYAQLLMERGAASVVALDFSWAMLQRAPLGPRVCATMMSLPFAADALDLIVSGLAVGHADDLNQWMGEAARVMPSGGTLLYSDFHPFGEEAGWQRSFRAADGRTFSVPHQTYTLADHHAAAGAAGLRIETVSEVRVGIELREAFDGSEEFYRRWHGMPIVLVVRMRSRAVQK